MLGIRFQPNLVLLSAPPARSFCDLVAVLDCREPLFTPFRIFEPEKASQVGLERLSSLRHSLAKVTDKALHKKAWDLSLSGVIGAHIKFVSGGSRDDEGRHQAVAVEISLSVSGIVCTCSTEEACRSLRRDFMKEPVKQSLDTVRAAMSVTMANLFEIFSVSYRMRSRAVGRAVLYEKSTCVVRKPGGSWPFAVARKTMAAHWIFFSCRRSDGSRNDAVAAGNVARLAAQGRTDANSESDTGSGEKDGDANPNGGTPQDEEELQSDHALA